MTEAATRGIQTCNFIKKETLAQVFSSEFCELFKFIFFTEHLRADASEIKQMTDVKCFVNILASFTYSQRGNQK